MSQACLSRLKEVLEASPPRGRLSRRTIRALRSEHDPWHVEIKGGCAGQRAFHRSTAATRLIVAGRQGGKTHCAAEEVVRVILRRPNTESCLLMPTYKSTKGALRHLKRALGPLEGHYTWREVDKVYEFEHGAKLYVRTCDNAKEGVPVRGMTLDGILWIDEASFVPRSIWEAARLTQSAVRDPLRVITTTARGRKGSWVFEMAATAQLGSRTELFRFRTTDSPHHNADEVAEMKQKWSRARVDEELNAMFVGDTHAPFDPEDIERAFAKAKLPIRGKQLTLGLDLGKQHDYSVIVLMNEFGEAWLLARWRADGHGQRFWVEAAERVVGIAKHHKAVVVLDRAGGAGDVMRELLEKELPKGGVAGVNTAAIREKAAIFEALIADLEHGRLQIDSFSPTEEESRVLRSELTFFPAPERRTQGGAEVLAYMGPADDEVTPGSGEPLHDDCVVALALANWGRTHCWTTTDPLAGDWSGYEVPLGGDGSDGASPPAAPGGWDDAGWDVPLSLGAATIWTPDRTRRAA